MTMCKQTERDGRSLSGQELRITGVEPKTHTVYMMIDGCRVTGVFRAGHNREVYSRLKGVLIDSFLNSASISSLT